MKTPAPITWSNVWAVCILRAADIFWASVIWRDYDITISAWTGLEMKKPKPARWAKILHWVLDHIQPYHCEGAIVADAERAKQALVILGG